MGRLKGEEEVGEGTSTGEVEGLRALRLLAGVAPVDSTSSSGGPGERSGPLSGRSVGAGRAGGRSELTFGK